MKKDSISYSVSTIAADQVAYVITNNDTVLIANNGDVDVTVGGFLLKPGQGLQLTGETSTINATVAITFSVLAGTKKLDILKEIKTSL